MTSSLQLYRLLLKSYNAYLVPFSQLVLYPGLIFNVHITCLFLKQTAYTLT